VGWVAVWGVGVGSRGRRGMVRRRTRAVRVHRRVAVGVGGTVGGVRRGVRGGVRRGVRRGVVGPGRGSPASSSPYPGGGGRRVV
jgi:hypothetical protein